MKHGFQQRQRAGAVVAKEELRLLHGFAGLDQGGEVHDGVDAMAGKDRIQSGAIGGVSHYQFGAGRHGGAVPAREVVVDNDRVPGREQLRAHHSANVARSTSHQDFHVQPPGDSTKFSKGGRQYSASGISMGLSASTIAG